MKSNKMILQSDVNVEYVLYLPNTGEWIKETSDFNIWIKTDKQFEAFNTGTFLDALTVLDVLCREKNLKAHRDIVLVSRTTLTEYEIMNYLADDEYTQSSREKVSMV